MTHVRKFKTSLFLLVILIFFGCSTSNDETADSSELTGMNVNPVTLTLMANQDWIVKPMMKRAIDLYEKKTGNRIELQSLPIDTVDTLISKRVALGEITDIVMHFGGTALSDLMPERNFVDMSREGWVEDLIEEVKPRLSKDGKLYGLPLWEASTSGTLYNKKIFAKLGIQPPGNQAEFFAACEILKEAGIVPVYLAGRDVWPMMVQYGIDYAVEKTPNLVEQLNTNMVNFEDVPAITEVVEWYRTMYASGYFGKNVLDNNWDSLSDALYSGKYAMVMAWDVYLYSDLEPKYPGFAEDFGLMPHFIGGKDAMLFEGPNAAMLMVNQNGRNVSESLEFIRILAQPSSLNEIYRDLQTGTYFKSVTTNQQTPQYIENQEQIDRFVVPSTTPFIIGYNQYEMGKWVQQAMTGAISVEESLRNMDAYRKKVAVARGIAEFQ